MAAKPEGSGRMIRVESIWLACGVSDLRAGMDTLLARVVRGFEGGAQMNTAYVFANRGATRLKVLVADSAGLWLCMSISAHRGRHFRLIVDGISA